jgi:hypothetical protein
MRNNADYNPATFGQAQLLEMQNEYKAIDDIHWAIPRNYGKHTQCNPVLEMNATWLGKPKNPTQAQKNSLRGGAQKTSKPNALSCHHCGNAHHIKDCEI